jgi:hypothetical protein
MSANGNAHHAYEASRAAIAAMIRAGAVVEADLAHLRQNLLAQSGVGRDEVDALFEVDASPARKCEAWTAFLVEIATDFAVWGERPTGVLNGSQAEWLLARCDASKSLAALAVLVNVLAEAHRVPVWFLSAARARAAGGWPGLEEPLRQALAAAAFAPGRGAVANAA